VREEQEEGEIDKEEGERATREGTDEEGVRQRERSERNE